MLIRSILLPSLVLLAACDASPQPEPSATPQAEVPVAPSPEPSPFGIPITAVGDLIGEYRVAGMDGEPMNAPIGIALSIDGPVMSFEPNCAGFVWTIAFDGGELITDRRQLLQPEAGAAPPAACAVAILPEHARLAEALDAATRAERTPQNGIVLSGDGHDVTLFSQ